MKYVKMLGLLAVAAAALMALAGSASANPSTLTSGSSNVSINATIHATAGTTELHNAVTTVTCGHSTVHGTYTRNFSTGQTAGGPINTLTFTNCNYPVTVLKAGSLSIASNGTTYSTGAEITIHGPFGVNCIYSTNATDVGTLTNDGSGKLHIESKAIPRTGHSAFCGSSGTWTGDYTVLTPANLKVH